MKRVLISLLAITLCAVGFPYLYAHAQEQGRHAPRSGQDLYAQNWLKPFASLNPHSMVTPATPCSYLVTPDSISIAPNGGSGKFNVTTSSTCSWTAVSYQSWIKVTAGSRGVGSNVVSYTVAANTGPEKRYGSIGIAPGRSLVITQDQYTISSYTISPSNVMGGQTAVGTITLNAPAPLHGRLIKLGTGISPAFPRSITIPEGAKTGKFTITTQPVSERQKWTIWAQLGYANWPASFEVWPATVSSLTLNPASVVGGSNVTATLTMNGPAPSNGAVVRVLVSNNLSAVTAPASVTVPAGATSKTFTITTTAVTASQSGYIQTTWAGYAYVSPTLTVRPVGLLSVGVNPNPITGGNDATGTVRLEQAAPADIVVSLSDNVAATTLPRSIVVPKGAASATFPVKTTAVTAFQDGVLTARANGTSRSAPLTVGHVINTCGGSPFASATPLPSIGRSIVADDFNNDGHVDLIGLKEDRVYSILLGDGMGGFGTPASFYVTSRPSEIAVADFNLDGYHDLVITDAIATQNNLAILLGDGTGHFSVPTRLFGGSSANHPQTGDFNNDGLPDIAVTNTEAGNSNQVAILLGNGSGRFSSPTYYPTNHAYDLALGDVNRDGNQDLVVASNAPPTSPSYPSGALEILLGDGTGAFSEATRYSFSRTGLVRNVAVGDFNRDNKPDLAASVGTIGSITSFRVAIMLGDGMGGFSAPVKFVAGQGSDQIVIADVNADSLADLVVSNTGSHSVSVLFSNGVGGFTPASNFPLGVATGPYGVALGDFNSDSKPDLAVSIPNKLAIMLNTCN